MTHPFYPAPLVLLDLETTGANPSSDRITEIGLIQVDSMGISPWSTLVNPCQAIPPFIQHLTGIDDAMVADAPVFADLADEVLDKLHHRIFVAHNARFDYTFLRNEFKRCGRAFRGQVLCTVQLSRKLYPDEYKHSLDALIARHDLQYSGERHRALTDAQLIYQFLQAAVLDLGAERVTAAINELIRPPALPSQIPESVIDDLPDIAGVYIFYGEQDEALWVGSSMNLRRRVLQHFGKKANEGPAAYLARDLRRIAWIETAGELGNTLLERQLIQTLRPRMNSSIRHKTDQTQSLWQIELPKAVRGEAILPLQPQLIALTALSQASGELFGPFRGAREAQNIMNRIIKAQGLCRQALGLEAAKKDGSPCQAHLQGDCRGACIGREPMGLHNGRLLAALAKHRLAAWPYAGAVAIAEGPEWSTVWHVLDHWCYLGTIDHLDQLTALLAAERPAFDVDMAKLIRSELKKTKTIVLDWASLAS
ncbi:exonuclease domain-containing protein [Deefgea salmonis]|uniref:DNA-directed DNA polymerase n=1 Tax=Deefgea salmonis TaxID=2875502 RepID=A0ABS8BN01_9NEIS|nr:exonuclease domain-containing protein [Deefgea salmonis]MCB5197098.1 GIY-YIG nuclease family protein [Deefgea salmonis]